MAKPDTQPTTTSSTQPSNEDTPTYHYKDKFGGEYTLKPKARVAIETVDYFLTGGIYKNLPDEQKTTIRQMLDDSEKLHGNNEGMRVVVQIQAIETSEIKPIRVFIGKAEPVNKNEHDAYSVKTDRVFNLRTNKEEQIDDNHKIIKGFYELARPAATQPAATQPAKDERSEATHPFDAMLAAGHSDAVKYEGKAVTPVDPAILAKATQRTS